MSLHDRITAAKNDTDGCADEQDYFECVAYNAGIDRAAIIASDADELMAEMARALRAFSHYPKVSKLCIEYDDWMERSQ